MLVSSSYTLLSSRSDRAKGQAETLVLVLSQHPRSPRVGFNRWRSGEEGQEKISAAAQKRLSID